uniref:Uncharacterized protein n=1 Tax=Salix viminalis TaxID=40686 RepID=A0A6N2NIS2_SALVM
MDSLIDDADDVKELRSNGIIVNFHGSDQQVADLFNVMGSSLEPDTSAYNDVKREINKQYESTLKRWVAEMQQTYFRSPWAFLAFAGAAAGLALTATQDTGKEDLYDNVKEELQKARGCYHESIKENFDDEEFIKMMFIDGCFILQFMHCLDNESEKLEMSEQQIFHKVGIRFWPRWTAGAITDVKFKSSFLSGKVEIPPIIIDESTESLLLNLVAYESAAALDQLWVSSYILFMDSLIDDAEDAEELRSNGIIINYLGAD